MNTQQIECILRTDRYVGPIFRGVYPLDKIVPFDIGACVMNTSPSTEISGHWVAIYATKNEIEFFDSYGSDPPTKLKKIWQNKTWSSNPIMLQSPLSSVCGQYCLYYLLYRARNYSMASILMDFDTDVDYNDEFVHEFMENRFDIDTKLIDTEGIITQLARARI